MDNFSLDAPNKQNYYEVLGLPDNSTQDQVTQSFRNIAQLYIDSQTHEQETEAETMPASRFQQSCEALLVLKYGVQGDKLLDFDSFEKALVSGGYAALKGDALLNLFNKYVKTVTPKLQKQGSSPADTSLKGSLYKSQTDDNYISDQDLESDSGSEISGDEDTNEKTDSGDDNKPFDAEKKDNEFRSEDFVNFANMDPFSSMLGVQIEEDSSDNRKFKSLEKFASRSVTFISDDKVKCNLCEDVIDQDELVEHLEEDHDEEFKRFKKDQKKKAQTKKSMLSAGR